MGLGVRWSGSICPRASVSPGAHITGAGEAHPELLASLNDAPAFTRRPCSARPYPRGHPGPVALWRARTPERHMAGGGSDLSPGLGPYSHPSSKAPGNSPCKNPWITWRGGEFGSLRSQVSMPGTPLAGALSPDCGKQRWVVMSIWTLWTPRVQWP